MKSVLWLSLVVIASSSAAGGEITGMITNDTTWTAAQGPYVLSRGVTVGKGVTVTIEPGTSVHLGSAVDFVITNGARLLAEGTPVAPIRFTRPPGATARWGGIVVSGRGESPETRISYSYFEGNDYTAIYSTGGTVVLDHLTFGTTDRQYLALDGSSFIVSHCYFPNTTAAFEPMHGSGGVKAGGHAIVRDCFFGTTTGYSDIIDFTGGNRERNQPIIEFYNNVFVGTGDDMLDLDGTDAWVEGNIFLHAHRNGAPDTSAAISGGDDRRQVSEVTIVGNLFFDCDQAATAKQGNFFTMLNNTIVHTTKTGGRDNGSGVLCVQDLEPFVTTFGAGFYFEGNIVLDAEQLVRNYAADKTSVTMTNNILPSAWEGPGGGNVIADPLLKHVPQLSETHFTNWVDAQVMRDWFSLLPNSPARGSGPNGRDKGGVVSLGAWISGEPANITEQNSATLNVGPNRSGHGIPASGWPNGSGYTHFKWRLDGGGVWSEEMPVGTSIALAGLKDGKHFVEVIGKRDSGWYQNDARLGTNAVVSRSRTWTVQTKR